MSEENDPLICTQAFGYLRLKCLNFNALDKISQSKWHFKITRQILRKVSNPVQESNEKVIKCNLD